VSLATDPRLGADHPHAGTAEIAAAAGVRLKLEDDPALVPLETLPGRNHHRFPPGEEPPWRWLIPSVYPG
jgi:hypothetical protein